MSALPIVPLADLVAELRTLHHIPCLAAADRLEEMAEEIADQARHWRDAYDHIDALRPLCPTCGGSGETESMVDPADLENVTRGPWIATPCPDCVDGHVTWQWLVNVFNAVWDDAEKDRVPTPLSARGTAVLYTFDTGVDRAFDHLRAVR